MRFRLLQFWAIFTLLVEKKKKKAILKQRLHVFYLLRYFLLV
jgi:hypothetical protein